MKHTKIEWASATFNPWWGCEKVSPACATCYAESFAKRVGQDVWGKDAPRRFFGDKHWNEPLKWNRAAEKSGQETTVFCASMADWLEDRRDLDDERHRLFRLIESTPALTWLLLTKRPEHFDKLAPGSWVICGCPAHVRIGVTAENQPFWHERVERLKMIPSRVRFVSAGPLLGPISCGDLSGIHQVIVEGETGHGARPMLPEWARGVRDQCVAAGVAFFFKQWGEWAPGENVERQTGRVRTATWFNEKWLFDYENLARTDGHIDDEPDLYCVGKKAAGRVLDGRTWDETPMHQTVYGLKESA